MEGVLHDVASLQTSRLAGQDAAEAQGGVLGCCKGLQLAMKPIRRTPSTGALQAGGLAIAGHAP